MTNDVYHPALRMLYREELYRMNYTPVSNFRHNRVD